MSASTWTFYPGGRSKVYPARRKLRERSFLRPLAGERLLEGHEYVLDPSREIRPLAGRWRAFSVPVRHSRDCRECEQEHRRQEERRWRETAEAAWDSSHAKRLQDMFLEEAKGLIRELIGIHKKPQVLPGWGRCWPDSQYRPNPDFTVWEEPHLPSEDEVRQALAEVRDLLDTYNPEIAGLMVLVEDISTRRAEAREGLGPVPREPAPPSSREIRSECGDFLAVVNHAHIGFSERRLGEWTETWGESPDGFRPGGSRRVRGTRMFSCSRERAPSALAEEAERVQELDPELCRYRLQMEEYRRDQERREKHLLPLSEELAEANKKLAEVRDRLKREAQEALG